MQIIEIRVNCPSLDVADEISRSLLKTRTIAASNRFQGIESSYHWQGTIECATEVVLLMKTRADLFDHVVRQAKALHRYLTPGITGITIDYANDDYKAWVFKVTAGAKLD